jgi:predicted permease
LETLLQDLRYGLRMLVKSPGFTAVAVLTLALGIGANTAIFTVINAAVLRTLPVPNPQQLVVLSNPDDHGMHFGNETGDRDLLSYHEFEEFRDRNDIFSGIFAVGSSNFKKDVTIGSSGAAGQTEPAVVSMVSGAYFSVLGVEPIIGRTFSSDVDKDRGANPVAVIGYNFWKRRFALSPTVLGEKIRVHQTPFEIIGVMPPGFSGETVGDSADFWVPLSMQAAVFPGRDFLTQKPGVMEEKMWLAVLARLKPGVTLAQANASINVLLQHVLEDQAGSHLSAENRRELLNQKIVVRDGSKGLSTVRARFSEPLVMLMVVVGLVLLIACANVANLLLARAATRQREIAVRLALGAGRRRLIRQLLTESVLLAVIGGAVGLLFAQWGDALLVQLVSHSPLPVKLDLEPDLRMLGFTMAVTLMTGILFGLAPAFRASRLDLQPVLKATGQNIAGESGSRMPTGKILVVSQVVFSLLLLVVAGLFLRSFQKLTSVDLGYGRENLLLFQVDPTASGYKGEATKRLFQQLLDTFKTIPGVRAATLSENGLFSHHESADPISIEGYTPKPGEDMDARFDQVGPGYFSTVGIPVLLGREIGPQDSGNGPRVGLINQTMARAYFPNTNPIGRRIHDTYPDNPADFEVVGVVADAKYNSLSEKTPKRFYAPAFNPIEPVGEVNYEIRTLGNPAAVASAIREAMKAADPTLLTPQIHTMDELIDGSLVRERMTTRLSTFFGFLALLLACIGLYGVMSYSVARRTNEIGIRMALGAQRGNVIWLVMRETLWMALIGVFIGVAAVLAVTRLIASMLFSVGATDPVAILIAVLVMLGVAALAGYIPARRASHVDPMVALHYE